MGNFGRIESEQLTGDEQFKQDSALTTGDFWRWAYSDLLNNTTRGVLAEFIVAQAIGDSSKVRTEWEPYDLKTPDGITVEVKSSAYIQSWHQDRLSTISFGIAPTKAWDVRTNTWSDDVCRQADVYVFCLLDCKDQGLVDTLDMEQWRFYVLPSVVLDENMPESKSISLSVLTQLEPEIATFGRLAAAVQAARR